MKYRLICVWSYDKRRDEQPSVTLEVCLNVGSKTISPFKRKITAYDLMQDFEGNCEYLLTALAGTGQIYQPFVFSGYQIHGDSILAREIRKLPYQYIRRGTSIMAIRESNLPAIKPVKEPQLSTARLIGAELTISNVSQWWRDIEVRFRYEDMTNLIPATNQPKIPFKNDSGIFVARDYTRENQFLANLYGTLNNRYSTLSFDKADTTLLKQSMEAGWKVFALKGHKHRSQLHPVRNAYGIDWFTTRVEHQVYSNELADKLLAAFLHSRNYYESNDGNIVITNNQQIREIPSKDLAGVIIPERNVSENYTPIHRLTDEERNRLKQTISTTVNASLMNFQFEGVVWLTEMRQHNTGCLLADDMGLGKTLQTLAYLSTRPHICHFLVVAPTSIVGNWEKEINEFVPQLRQRIQIISFDQLRLNPDSYSVEEYDTLIIDEGQMVKNANTKRYQAFGAIRRAHAVMLSGTPIENGIHEIWAQFNILIPGILALQQKLQQIAGPSDNPTFIELSKKLLSGFILRRVKESVLEKFPNKRVNNIYVDLTRKERGTYDKIRQIVIRALETGVTSRVNSLVLTGLLRLRQACVCPDILPQDMHYADVDISSKFKVAISIIESNLAIGNKVLVFSQFTSALERFRQQLDNRNIWNLMLIGSTTDRLQLVDAFNTSDDAGVFLISLRAGGTGLNLTSATRVILLDDWWNPAVDEQAFARSYRIGQTKNVEVFRIICRNTIEEKIIELQDKKKGISDLFNTDYGRISIEDIRNLIE